MAQIRLRDFKDPLNSFEHNLINLGVHKPGRFAGFDIMTGLGGLNFKIQHSGPTVRNDLNDSIGPLGVFMTTQGVRVIELDELPGPFTVQSNAGNNFERVDLLVANHQFVNIAGGQSATYSIITGPIGGAGDPPLSNPDFQVILGRIFMPPNAASINLATYVKAKSPDSGDGEDARLNTPNQFSTLNRFNFSSTTYNAPSNSEILGGSKIGWTLKDDGNNFRIEPSPPATNHFIDAIRLGKSTSLDGVEIKIQITSYCTIRAGQTITPADRARGFDPIIIPASFGNSINSVDSTLQLKPTDGEIWTITLLRASGNWVVISSTGSSSSPYRKGMLMEIVLTNDEINQNFEPDGLGKNLYAGWQWANGLRGTVDMRCRVSVMASAGPNQGASVLSSALLTYAIRQAGGNAMVTLNTSNLPSHVHYGLEAEHTGHSAASFTYPFATYVSLLVNTPSSGLVNINNAKTGTAGSNQAFDVRQPFLVVGKIQRL